MNTYTLLKHVVDEPEKEEVWQELWNSESRIWFSIAYSILQSASFADDAIQNAVLYISQHASDFIPRKAQNPETSCRAWLNKIVINSALQLKRSHQSYERRNESHGIIMHTTQIKEAFEIYANKELISLVNNKYTELSEAHQISLSLYYGANLDYKECAATLECTENSARVRVHRALKALRKLIRLSGINCSLLLLGKALTAHEVPFNQSHLTIKEVLQSHNPAISKNSFTLQLPKESAIFSLKSIAVSASLGLTIIIAYSSLAPINVTNSSTPLITINQRNSNSTSLYQKYDLSWLSKYHAIVDTNNDFSLESKIENEVNNTFFLDSQSHEDFIEEMAIEFTDIIPNFIAPESWDSNSSDIYVDELTLFVKQDKPIQQKIEFYIKQMKFFHEESHKNLKSFKQNGDIPKLLSVPILINDALITKVYDLQFYEYLSGNDQGDVFIDNFIANTAPEIWARDGVGIEIFNDVAIITQTDTVHKSANEYFNHIITSQ